MSNLVDELVFKLDLVTGLYMYMYMYICLLLVLLVLYVNHIFTFVDLN